MAIQTVPRFSLPDWRSAQIGVTGFASGALGAAATATLDGASDAFALTFCPPVAGDLEAFAFRTVTVSVTSGPLDFDGRIESVGTNGRPSGTLLDTDSNGAISVADTDDNVIKTCTLTTPVAVTPGTPIAIRVNAPGSGTFSVTNGGFVGSGFTWTPNGFPLYMVDTNGDGTFDAFGATLAPVIIVQIDGVWYPIDACWPFSAMNLTNYTSASNPNERAVRIEYANGVQVCGMRAYIGNLSGTGSVTFTVWPDSASAQTDADALRQVVLDSDLYSGNTQDNWMYASFAPFTVAAGSVIWAGVRRDSATNGSLLHCTFITGAEEANPAFSDQFYLGTRNWSAGSANAFTPDTTQIPMIELLCNGQDVGGGSSGGGIRLAGHGGLAA